MIYNYFTLGTQEEITVLQGYRGDICRGKAKAFVQRTCRASSLSSAERVLSLVEVDVLEYFHHSLIKT